MSDVSVSRGKIRDVTRQYLIREFLAGEDPSELTDSTPLITGGILDSIASVKLVSFLEESFGIRFEAHEISTDCLDNVDLIVETVSRKVERQS
jgi:acyl carrier protein